MAAGRPPKPSNLKLLEGGRGKRGVNKQEPDPEYISDLSAPAWLPKGAAAVWDEIIPHLAKAKLVAHVDIELLAQGCVAIANFRYSVAKAGDNLVKCKHTVDEEGKPVEVGEHVNPWLIVQSMSFKQSMKVFEQFGMSPAARTRIAIQPQGDLFAQTKNGTDNYFT